MRYFDIECLAFSIWNYPVSYIELLGTLFGLVSVWYASRANILTWPTGIINELCLFFLFFQVQLYADMFLQLYFFVVTLYGWHNWNTKTASMAISNSTLKLRMVVIILVIAGSLFSGFIIKDIHYYLPQYFKVQAAYPYTDSFVMVASIFATILLSRKKIENWYLWIMVDLVCVFIYYQKGIYFLALEYLIFLGLAIYGLYYWRKQLRNG